jgi:hypothetical protein
LAILVGRACFRRRLAQRLQQIGWKKQGGDLLVLFRRNGNSHHQLATTEEIRRENDEHDQENVQENGGQEQRPPAPARQFLFRACIQEQVDRDFPNHWK